MRDEQEGLRTEQQELNMNEKKVEQFKDLIAWQKARELARKIYEATKGDHLQRTLAFLGTDPACG